MLRLHRLYPLFALLAACSLVFGLGGFGSTTVKAQVAPTRTPTKTPIITSTPAPTLSPTPVVQAGAEPQAWLDGSIDLEQFPPKGALVVHFNTPMLAESSPNPLLVWPSLQGIASWDETKTTLTFTPATTLDSKKAYTFFLDPALRSADTKALNESPQWVALVDTGPKVTGVTPSAGRIANRRSVIEVSFNRDMDPSSGAAGFSIEPKTDFDLRWKSARVLEIKVREPLAHGQRYDLTLSGGGGPNSLLAADGSYLAEDYRWFYSQPQLTVTAQTSGPNKLEINFNTQLDQASSGLPFNISPALDGKWGWASLTKIVFIASQPIPASQEYTVTFTGPLVDMYGVETTTPPAVTFTGLTPIHLATTDIKKSEYGRVAYFYTDVNLEEIKLRFDMPVDHASAEQAFSLRPAAPGKFSWETGEILVYTLDELLKQNSSYTLQMDTTVKNPQGQALITRPYRQEFNVGSDYYSAPATFGQYGENIQLVDANGPRRLQFGGGGEGLYFSAYRFDLIDFAKSYSDHFHVRGYSYSNTRDIPTPAGAQPAAIWTNVSTRTVGEGDEAAQVVETTLPGELAPGLYVVNLRLKERLHDQIYVVVTRNTLVVKNDGDDLFVWLTNINGQNVPNAEVRVYGEGGEKLREGQTDENGQYRVSIPPGTEPMLVSARALEKDLPEDVTVTGFDNWFSSFPYNYNDPSRYFPRGQPYLVYLYTERPLYRPGQVVNFKAIVRKDDDVRYSTPKAGTPIQVDVKDARGNLLESFELHTNDFGTVNGTVSLSDGAMLGDYAIETEVDGVTTSQAFKVDDYRKPDYEIKITSLQPEKKDKFVRGEEIKVQVNAAYYFGEPLANAKLQVNFYNIGQISANHINNRLITDENGNAELSFEAPYQTEDYYYPYSRREVQSIRMEVTANDGSNQTVSQVYAFRVYPASEQLKLDTGGYYAQPGKPLTLTVSDNDLLGQPVAGRELTLEIETWDRKTFKLEPTDKHFTLKTDEQGKATQEITLDAGYYDLTISGKDPANNEIQAHRWIYVFGDGRDWFQRSRENQMEISSDKDSYKPYEKARFAIESSFSGPALLAFERGSVINTKMIELTAPLTMIETDIIPEHAPNVYVTVNAWQKTSSEGNPYNNRYYMVTEGDSHLRLAKMQIQVDTSAKALDISIQTDKQTYAPGEKVSAVIQVKDADGKPALAELSLAVVDESIFALADDLSGDIFDAFYSPRGHSVDTYDSMSPSRIIFDSSGRGGGGGEPPPAARSNFLDTSAWLPVVHTDANGQATVTFDLPDNTTSWRLSVKAVTLNHHVGQAQTNIETKKEVFVRPVLPRVLTNGDQAALTAFVHNYSAQSQTVQVNLSAGGLEVQGQNDQQLTLKAGEVQPIGWQVRVSGAKPTEVTITARVAGEVLDAVRLPLLLQPSAVRDQQNQSGKFSGTLTLGLPLPNVERETAQVRLTLNRSMSGTILSGLDYLTGYPYGCVEQTMSRALPNAVVGRAAEQLGIGGPALQLRVSPLIEAGIQRLYGLQHSDGGWGWWVDDASDAYETAWVLFGLGLMDSPDNPVEPQVMDRAASWLKEQMKDDDFDLRTRAYALYALAEAGRGDLAVTQALASESAMDLDPFSQAALALALERLGEKAQAAEMLALLSQSAFKTGEEVYWPQPSYDGEYHHKTMASTIRTTALVLLAYARIDPHHASVPGIVKYLADKRQGMYGWGTTNETSYTILALTEYFASQERESGEAPYEVFVNGKSLFSGTLQVGNSSASLDIPLAELQDGLNTLTVNTDDEHVLYFDLSTRYDLLRTQAEAAGKISVVRRYLDPKTNARLESIDAGQLVKVQLGITVPDGASFMAVEDYLPGGLEALNEGLNATSKVTYDTAWGYENYRQFYWEDYGYNYKEIRGDRVVFFITTFEKGIRTFTYFARATTPGQFTSLPAQAYAMYDLGMWGRSEGDQIQIEP